MRFVYAIVTSRHPRIYGVNPAYNSRKPHNQIQDLFAHHFDNSVIVKTTP